MIGYGFAKQDQCKTLIHEAFVERWYLLDYRSSGRCTRDSDTVTHADYSVAVHTPMYRVYARFVRGEAFN